jgi:SAM-dependent methyltransferase
MTEQSARFIGSIPTNYDDGLGPHIFFGFADDLAGRAALHGPRRVLELAAGTGIFSRRLRDAMPADSSLMVTDLNPPMLEVAQGKFAGDEAVLFEQADASKLRFADSSFDLVSCQFGVMFFPDKVGSFKEVRRVLTEDGHYLFNVWGSWASNPFARIAHETVAGFFPDDPPGFYRVPFGYCDPVEISNSLNEAGFETVNFDWVELTSDIISCDLFARGLIYGNPLFEEVTQRGGDPKQVCRDVSSALATELGSTMPIQALVFDAS